jgi:nickel-type superoxide dismutase maturation protease
LRGLALGAGLAGAVAARRWLDIIEVQGASMAPTLLPGDWLIVERRTYARRAPRVGEIVVAADPREADRELIKRVAAIDLQTGTLDLRGDAPETSTDSRAFGPVPMKGVQWRVIARYWPANRIGGV